MTHSVLKQYGPQGKHFTEVAERKALKREKVGVIGGFLVGVLLVTGVINPLLESAGLPSSWAHLTSAVLIAACTLAGYGLGTAGRPKDQA